VGESPVLKSASHGLVSMTTRSSLALKRRVIDLQVKQKVSPKYAAVQFGEQAVSL
jgi:hypothetical protein